jgi:hypothetical protein
MLQVVLALLLAGQPTPQQTPPAGTTIQQLFDRGTKAAAEGECKEAVGIFEDLETKPQVMRSPMVRAAINVRKGSCLIELNRLEEGEVEIRRGRPRSPRRAKSLPWKCDSRILHFVASAPSASTTRLRRPNSNGRSTALQAWSV